MKVRFLKAHQGHKEGDSADLPDGVAQYLIRVGAARKSREKAEIAEPETKAEPAAEHKASPEPTTKKKTTHKPKKKH